LHSRTDGFEEITVFHQPSRRGGIQNGINGDALRKKPHTLDWVRKWERKIKIG